MSKPAYQQDTKKYCEDCKWFKSSSRATISLCMRPVVTDVHRNQPLGDYVDGERRSGMPGACGKSGKYWEEYIPPKRWWQKLRTYLTGNEG
jgi:hypothetical protein